MQQLNGVSVAAGLGRDAGVGGLQVDDGVAVLADLEEELLLLLGCSKGKKQMDVRPRPYTITKPSQHSLV